MKSLDSPFWREAIDNEIQSIIQNHTWELTDLPPGCKPLGANGYLKRNSELMV